MTKPKTTLPPQIGKWLASKNPTLVEKAEAALQEAEPDADEQLRERIKSYQKREMLTALVLLGTSQLPHHVVSKGYIDTVSQFCAAIMVDLTYILLLSYLFVRPVSAQRNALILTLVRRGDVRSIPLLLHNTKFWKAPAYIQADFDNALTTLFQKATPGETPLTDCPDDKDPAASLRVKFTALTPEPKGKKTAAFKPAATTTPQKVQLWLALLPHLAAQADPKSRNVLRRIAEAHPSTLDEELIQQTAHALLAPTPETGEVTQNAAAIPHTKSWKPTAVNPSDTETPAQLQRLRRP